jgi:peptide/nickel transport system permease protein
MAFVNALKDCLRRSGKRISSLSIMGKTGLLLIILIVFIAVFAPLVTIHPFNTTSGPPLSPPGKGHIFGTDELGVDIWSQICYGARVSLLVGICTAILAALGGGIIGMVAAYFGGILDKIIMRLIDIIMVLPDFPVMMVLSAFLGPSLINIVLVLALFSWVAPARIVRSQILALKKQYYIKSAVSYGAGVWYLIRRHFIPETLPLIAVNMIRLTGRAIVAEAGLSFLGLGDPSSKSWGLIIHYATSFEGIYYTDFWKWWLLFPWAALTLMVLSLAFLSRDMENLVDPRIRR